jgi:GTP cyclohydrolase II
VPHAPPQTVPMVEPLDQHAPVEVPVIPQAVVPETRVPPETFSAPERHDTPGADTALASAVETLRDCGQALELRIGDADADEDLLEGCAQAAQAVAELLEPLAEDGAGAVVELHEEALEVSETLVLLGLERTGTAAADAVTLLLQLRRDIACARAA